MKEVTYKVHIEPSDEGGYITYFPALPGCHTQGDTLEEVVAMAKDALALYLESLQVHGERIPVERPPLKQAGFDLPLTALLANRRRACRH